MNFDLWLDTYATDLPPQVPNGAAYSFDEAPFVPCVPGGAELRLQDMFPGYLVQVSYLGDQVTFYPLRQQTLGKSIRVRIK